MPPARAFISTAEIVAMNDKQLLWASRDHRGSRTLLPTTRPEGFTEEAIRTRLKRSFAQKPLASAMAAETYAVRYAEFIMGERIFPPYPSKHGIDIALAATTRGVVRSALMKHASVGAVVPCDDESAEAIIDRCAPYWEAEHARLEAEAAEDA